jgi:endonuclease YncB( thermonuclease family)
MSRVPRALGALITAALAAAATLALAPAPGGGAAHGRGLPGAGRVVRVVDGDTVVVAVAGTTGPVRLIGIDTPETVAPNRPVECYGPEASARLKHLLPPGTAVRLWRDVEPRDRYGRLLAYVQRAGDGLFVNLDQVRSGAAIAKAFPPNTWYRAAFEDEQSRARAAGLGLWGRCGGADVALAPPAGAGGEATANQ